MASDVRERIRLRLEQFQVGQVVNSFLDNEEVEGVLVSISQDKKAGKVKTSWGILTVNLALTYLVG